MLAWPCLKPSGRKPQIHKLNKGNRVFEGAYPMRCRSYRGLGRHYAYIIVLCCIIITNIPLGLLYGCSGLFFTPVADYLGVPTASFTAYFSISNLAILMALPIMGRFVDRFDIRFVIVISSAALAASFFGMSLSSRLWQFYLCGALMGVSAIPHLYFVVPILVNAWFEVRTAFFTGLSFSFMGVSGIVFSPILNSIIVSAPEGWRSAYVLVAVIVFIATVPLAALVVKPDPASLGLAPLGADEEEGPARRDVGGGATLSEAARCTSFWELVAFNGIVMAANTIMQFIPSYTQSFARSAPQIAALTGTVASMALLGQTLGMLFLGTVCDRSIKLGTGLGCAFGAMGMLVMWRFPSSSALLFAGAFLFGAGYASAGVANPLLPRAVFGSRDYNSIYARISMGGAVVSVFASVLWGIVVDMPDGFSLMFAIGISCLVLATAAAWFALAHKWRSIG